MTDELAGNGDRLSALEDRLLALETKGRWVVYALCYNDATSIPFYVGITTDLKRRVSQHRTDKASAAYTECQDGFTCSVIREFNKYPEALLFETMQIALRPDLVNRDISSCRAQLCLPDEFWALWDGWELARRSVLRTVIEQVREGVRQEFLTKAVVTDGQG